MEEILSLTFIIMGCALLLVVAIRIFLIPISIANSKNLTPNETATIKILTWLGLFNGITWFIALFLSFLYKESEIEFEKQ